MDLNAIWVVPLVAGTAGAVALAVVAALVRREVQSLQRSMRPLRVRDRRQSE